MASDAELLRESRRRPDAYVDVCRRHVADLSGWLRKQVGAVEADDLLAETLARGWYARKRFRDPGTGSAGPWLQAIAGNVVREYRRRGAIELRARRKLGLPAMAEAYAEEDADERLSAQSDFAALDASLSELPAEQRSALELRVVAELDYDEIGSRLGVSATTARTRVHRALQRLRLTMNGGEQ
jgi:RNA polymerase sigma-70 factor (ECF subfamily)